MKIQERLEIYSNVSRLLATESFDEIDDYICETYNQYESQDDLSLVVGLLRLTFQWKDNIPYWNDVAQLTSERINNSDKVMRGLTWEKE